VATIDLVEDRRSMELSRRKFSTDRSSLEAQKALTGKNLGGYDALTVTNLVNNGVWDGHDCCPQDGKLRARVDRAGGIVCR
jgi:hypothetical protein